MLEGTQDIVVPYLLPAVVQMIAGSITPVHCVDVLSVRLLHLVNVGRETSADVDRGRLEVEVGPIESNEKFRHISCLVAPRDSMRISMVEFPDVEILKK